MRREASQSPERPLREVLSDVADADEDGHISVNEVLRSFDNRSSGVVVLMLGLLAAIPMVGAIPGMSIATASLILLAIAREAFGGGALRLPGRLGRLSLPKEKFERAVEKARVVTDPIDKLVHPRLTGVVEGSLARALIFAAVALLALAMYPLAFVPWGVTAPSIGIVAFGLALVARDGLFALFGYAMIAATVATWVALI